MNMEHETRPQIDLDTMAVNILRAFPELNLIEQKLSLELYDLLVEGHPVPHNALAKRLEISVGSVGEVLDSWPGVFSDAERRVVGYWGLSIPSAYSSPHRLTIGARKLSAWCAWDTLFLPQLLGQTAEVESDGPAQDSIVRLVVTPERVEHVDPVGAVMSFLLPDPNDVRKDVVTTFCHFIHFFPSRRAGDNWIAKHPGTLVMSIDEAAYVARRKNEMQYRDTLPTTPHV